MSTTSGTVDGSATIGATAWNRASLRPLGATWLAMRDTRVQTRRQRKGRRRGSASTSHEAAVQRAALASTSIASPSLQICETSNWTAIASVESASAITERTWEEVGMKRSCQV